MTTRTMLKMTGTAIIPAKTAKVMLLPVVLMDVSGDVAGVVGQVAEYCVTTTTVVGQVAEYCVTTTPVKANKLGHC